MKNRFAVVLFVILNIVIINILPLQSYSGMPDKIRVGLKYGSGSPAIISVSSEKGGKIGVYKDGSFTPIIDYTKSDVLNIESDNSYHIQVGGSFVSYRAAMNEIINLRKSCGALVAFYPVFNGRWYVYTGSYPVANKHVPEYVILNSIFKNTKPLKMVKGSENSVFVSTGRKSLFAYDGNSVNSRIQIRSVNPDGLPLLNLGKAQYRGLFELYRLDGGSLILVNELNFEEYLYSVLPAEMPPGLAPERDKRIEALKVQALTARTFAYNQIKSSRYSSYGFDTDDTTNTQVYAGYTKASGTPGEYANSNEAVDKTKGKILLYNNSPALYIYYHSNDGGYKEDASTVWSSSVPYIKSGKDDYTARYKGTIKTWSGNFTGNSINAAFVKYIKENKVYNTDIGTLEKIEVISRADSGRITEMQVTGSKNSVTLKKESCRYVLQLSVSSQLFNFQTEDIISLLYSKDSANKRVFSSRALKVFEGEYYNHKFLSDTYALVDTDGKIYERLRIKPSDNQLITINGKGTGHGLGMSQDGAMQMSAEGLNAKAIVDFYYPGVVISD